MNDDSFWDELQLWIMAVIAWTAAIAKFLLPFAILAIAVKLIF